MVDVKVNKPNETLKTLKITDKIRLFAALGLNKINTRRNGLRTIANTLNAKQLEITICI